MGTEHIANLLLVSLTKCTIVAMEQANAGNCFGRNHYWLVAINGCVGLDALACTDNGNG
jgi:hypothetical protein